MAQIIDFPTNRIKRVVFLDTMRLDADQQHEIFEYLRDLLREGLSAREAVAEALESVSCR